MSKQTFKGKVKVSGEEVGTYTVTATPNSRGWKLSLTLEGLKGKGKDALRQDLGERELREHELKPWAQKQVRGHATSWLNVPQVRISLG